MGNPLAHTFSFSSQLESFLSPTQYAQNSVSSHTEGVRRVTLRQLINATRDYSKSPFQPFIIEGIEIKRFITVANVRQDILQSGVGRQYEFWDCSGKLDGRFANPDYQHTYECWAYARITGELEETKGIRTIKVISIQAIYDPHEIYFHVLRCIIDTLTYERGPPPPENVESSNLVSTGSVELLLSSQLGNLSMFDQSQDVQYSMEVSESSNYFQSPNPVPALPVSRSRLTTLQRDIVACLTDKQLYRSNQGVPLTAVIRHIKVWYPEISSAEFSTQIEKLINLQLIDTEDNFHYTLDISMLGP